MSRPSWMRVLLAALALSLLASVVGAAPGVPGELIVRFRSGASGAQKAAALSRVPTSTRLRDFDFIDASLVHFTGMSTERAIAELRKDPGVLYAEPNYEIHLDRVPNDPRFAELYAMRNLGQTGGLPGADIRATLAWDLFTGDPNLKIGVIDTGIDWSHPDLAANIWTNPGEIAGNGIDDDHNGYVDDIHGYDVVSHDGDPMDDHGHGTHCSGTIAGVGDNGVGVVGVNWHLKLVGIKFLNAGGGGTTAGAIEAVQYAIAAGVRLTSNSWGGGDYSAALLDAINAAGAAGQLFIAAAGNESSNMDLSPHYPAGYETPYVIAVGASDHTDHLAGFSNYGVNGVDLAAPGVDILSTFRGGGYEVHSGTSMACPHAAGVFALAAGRFPLASNLQLRELVLSSCDSVPSLAGLIHGARRLNAYQAILLPDSLPPAPVANLAVESVGSTALGLSWTASGDDDTSGTAAGYDLRYSLAPIDSGNFGSATPAPTGAPLHSGLTEHVEVKGLAYNSTYYFALRVRDELGNASPISNFAYGATVGIPHIEVTPASLTESLLTGDVRVQHLTIRNTGSGRLDFTVSSPESLLAGVLSRIAVTVDPDPDPGPGGQDPRGGYVGARGPDRGGYRWRTSDDAGGRAFDWQDITGNGTAITFAGGELSDPIALGFAFPYYGRTLTTVRVGANGVLTFGGTGSRPDNTPLPTPTLSADLVAPWWQAFGAGGARSVLFQRERGRFVVSFVDVPTTGSNPTRRTFQAILEPSGRILFQYLSLGTARDQGTVGIQDPTRTMGLLVAFNAAFVHDRQAIEFLPAGQWLTTSPTSGQIAAGASLPLDVTFDAGGLYGGDYDGEVRIASDDPGQPTMHVPVSLHVTGAPDIAVTPDSLAYGGLFIGATRMDSVRVRNLGTDVLHVSGVSCTPPVFTAPGGAFDLGPGGERVLAVAFTPTAAIAYSGTLTVTSDDHDEPVAEVRLDGLGLVPPDIAVTPDHISADLFTGATAERTIVLSNTGGSDLDFRVRARRPAVGSLAPASLFVPAVDPETLTAVTHNRVDPRAAAPVVRALYSGTHVTFGISDLGELMPFQYPIGNEHLARGTYLDGYTLAYEANGSDHIAFSVYAYRSNIVPFSYHEVENSASRAIVEVITRTGDGYLAIHRLFTFRKDQQVVDVVTSIENLSGLVISNLVFKEDADWDADGEFYDTWDYDRSRNLVHASFNHFVGIASEQEPAVMDVSGWNDFDRRATTVELPTGPIAGLDGLEVLHFELGTLDPGQTTDVHLAYGAANSLAELQALMDDAVAGPGWLSLEPNEGVVPAGGTLTVHARFDAAGLFGGTYTADVHVTSNDPDEPDELVSALLHVTGAPDIVVEPDSLHYGQPFAGNTRIDTVVVRNTGTDVLNLTSIVTTGAPFFITDAPGSLAPGESRTLAVRYSPTVRGAYQGELRLDTNDPDEASVHLPLSGFARVPPDIAVAPTDISADLLTGDDSTSTITITNSDAQELFWRATVGTPSVVATSPVFGASAPSPDKSARTQPPPPPPAGETWHQAPAPTAPISPIHAPGYVVSDGSLEAALAALDAGAAEIGAAIPNRYDFSEGETGNNISDGGNDMYDGGNFLLTELGLLNYSNGAIANSPIFGAGGRYFTRKYPGLFVLVADHAGISSFMVQGNLGADGSGNVDGSVLQLASAGVTYRGFVKRVYNAFDPSVNHMVIVADAPTATQAFSTNTNDDFHQVSGLQGTRRLYYLLYAGAGGDYIDDVAALEIMKTFLRVLRPAGPWLELTPSVGVLSPGAHADVTAHFRAAGLVTGDYLADVHIESDDPDESDLVTHAHLHVTGAPDIAVDPDSLGFPTTFVGSARLDTVEVSNVGTDLLSVSAVTSSSGHFLVPGAGFDLAPGASRLLPVSFAPTAPGALGGTLTILSNDHDRPAAIVDLHGMALIPPDIDVTPDSLVADLFTGDTTQATITLRNTGGSDLTFNLQSLNAALGAASLAALEAALPPAGATWAGGSHAIGPLTRAGDPAVVRASVAGASTLLLTTTDVSTSVERALAELGVAYDYAFTSRFASIPFAPYQTIVVSMDGGDPGVADVQALANAAAAGKHLVLVGGTSYPPYYDGLQGFLLHHTNQQGWTTSAPPHLVVTEPLDPLAAGLPSPTTFVNSPASFYMLRVSDPDAGVVALNGDGRPALLHKNIGSGSLVYFIDSPFSPYWSAAPDFAVLRKVMENALAWSGSSWLSFQPPAGTVPAGGQLDVVARFDAAGLFGGDYRAVVHVRSNDPDEPDETLAAHLHVTGRPDIAVTPDSLAFGSLFIGLSRTDTMHVSNPGTDVLHVSSVATGAPFGAPAGAFDLAPGGSRDLLVSFTPTTEGSFAGAVTISSDDFDEPTRTVHLFAQGLIPPDIAVAPDSLFADLFTGDTTERVVTVRNDGGSDLSFKFVAKNVLAAGLPPGARVPVPEALRGPTPNTLAPQAGAPVVKGSYTGSQLAFGLSDLGEVMPFQSPLGSEHLAWGTFLAGYTVAYRVAGIDHVGFTVSATRFNVIPFSYQEIENSPTRAVVEVVTHTGDGILGIRRRFTFLKDRRYVTVATRLENLTSQTLDDVVFKEEADWDADGNFYTTWNYDTGRHLVYTSSAHYVGIASEQVPSQMDLYGWNDYDRRFTTVDFTTGPVLNFDGLEVLHFELGAVHLGESRDVTVAYGAGNTLADLQSAMDEAVGGPPWLSFSPADGVVHAGGQLAVRARFDASGLIGGNYAAAVHVTSNDPDEPDVPIGAALHVTGVPNIALIPDSLAFGALFVGATRSDTLTVTNTGSDVLHVTAVAASPGHFHAPSSPFDLAVGASRTLTVTFAPTAPGVFAGTLTVTSDAHNAPAATAQLFGEGLIAPDIAVSPESLSVSLNAGDSTTRVLTLLNTGGSELGWLAIATASSLPDPGASLSAAAAGAIEVPPPAPSRPGGVRVALALEGGGLTAGEPAPGPDATAANDGPAKALGAPALGPPALVSLESVRSELDAGASAITALIPQRFDFTEGEFGSWINNGGGVYNYGNLLYGNSGPVAYANGAIVSNDAFGPGARYFTRKYPGLFVLAADPDSLVGFTVDGNLLFRGFGTVEGAQFSATIGGVSYRAFVKRVFNNGGPSVNHMIIVADAPTASQTFPISPSDDYHQVFGLSSSRRLYYLLFMATDGLRIDDVTQRQIMLEFLGTVSETRSWLAVDPGSGSTPAGGSTPLSVRFDATGLLGGTYRGAIQVPSNDPDESPLVVPVSMRVIGAPRLATSRDSIAFGSLFVGLSKDDSVTVRNSGTDVLAVSSVSAAPGAFTVPTAPFSLPPGGQRTLVVHFAPAAAGSFTGALTLVSNDPAHPSTSVVLTGAGLAAPVAGIAPPSLSFTVPEGGRQQQTLTLSNTGGSDLVFSVGTATSAVTAAVAVTAEAIRTSPTLPAPRENLKSRRVAMVTPAQAQPDATGNRVLVIADHGTEADLVPLLVAGGYVVTVVSDDSIYDGTNPPLAGFNLVVLPDGPGATSDMPPGGQAAILAFVSGGGGMISTEWLAYEVANGHYTTLQPLIPLTWGSYGDGSFTWNVTTAHPVTAGVSPSFNVSTTADLGIANSGTVLVTSGTGEPMVIVKQVGSGRVVHFSCGGNYNGYQPFLVPDMQRLFLNAANWISGASVVSASPSAGVVPAHGSLDLTVTADAGLLHTGTYNNSLLIATNDPVHALLTVPATVTVTAAADIALAPDTLRFAATVVGGSRVDTVQVSNPGSLTLHVTAVATTAPFSVPAAGFDLAPGAIRKLAVTFAPGSPGTFTRSLAVSSDDPDEPTATIALKGTGLPAGLRDEAAATGDPPAALSLALHGLVPNPPVRDLMVSFTLPDAEPATLELLDLAGRRLRQVDVGRAGPGRHSLSLGAVGSLRSGVYLVRLKHHGHSLVSKCVLMR